MNTCEPTVHISSNPSAQVASEPSPGKYPCDTCLRAFSSHSLLQMHSQTCNPSAEEESSHLPHVCGKCGTRFAFASTRDKHWERCTFRSMAGPLSDSEAPEPPNPKPVNPAPCQLWAVALQSKVVAKEEGPFRCEQCRAEFDDRERL